MDRKIAPREVWGYVVKSARMFPLGIASMFLAVAAYAVSVSINPYFLKVILNRAADRSSHLIGPIAGYLGTCFFLIVTYRLYNYLVEVEMIPRMREKIASHSFEKFLNKSHAYFQDAFSGSLSGKINDLSNSIPDLFRIVIDRFFSHFLTTLIATVVLAIVNPLFALFMLLWNATCIALILGRRKKLAHLSDNWSELASRTTGKMVDVFSNILSVRLFSARNMEKRAFAQTFQESVVAEQTLQRAYLGIWMWYSLAAMIWQLLNFYLLYKGWNEGWVSIGDFALVLSINLTMFGFMWSVAEDVSRFGTLYGRITQALRAILDPTILEDQKDVAPIHVSRGEIVFSGVHFNYGGAEPLFQNKTVTITPGQKVGLVGYSGGGKTTFVNLILRLYDVTAGHILIDGQDIAQVTQDSLRANIAMIPQDPSLFHRTLMENIRYGRIDATDAEVMEAAKRAHAHEFIAQLPQGYNSLIGERGVKLSGGQRQRIAIARAILKNAPILILDEATSQLDSVTEKSIQESLRHLMQGKTTVVIAHRLSTLLHMDRILVFDKGIIVEDGTHHDLLHRGGLYKTLWSTQIGGLLPDQNHTETT